MSRNLRLRVVCVGKPADRAMESLHDRYGSRVRRLGAEYDTRFVADVRAEGLYSPDHAKEREGRALLDAAGSKGTLIALDSGGRLLTSEDLARKLDAWAAPIASFLVGGPLGLHPSVLDRADFVWALSTLTFPHELVRVVLAEQLYRALTILRRVPYHK